MIEKFFRKFLRMLENFYEDLFNLRILLEHIRKF